MKSVLALKLDCLQVPERIEAAGAFVIRQLVVVLILLLRGRFLCVCGQASNNHISDGLASRATMSLVSGGLATSHDSIDCIDDNPSSHRHHCHIRDRLGKRLALPLT